MKTFVNLNGILAKRKAKKNIYKSVRKDLPEIDPALVDAVMKQIRYDAFRNNTAALRNLIRAVPVRELIQYLPKEEMFRYFPKVCYQPDMEHADFDGSIFSFEVYADKDAATEDFPNIPIRQLKVEEIDNAYFLDL